MDNANDVNRGDRGETAAGNVAFSREPLIRLAGISKGFEYNSSPIHILRDAALSMHQGESIAVVGESGIGKSTLLHILGTLDKPDSGQFFFRGQNVFDMEKSQLASFRNTTIGFVFQFHYLLAEFTALENVMMPGLIAGMGRNRIKPEAEAILVRVGLKDRLSHRVNDLSGGEQQRVALARALVMKPPLLLADEPTGNLDIRNSIQVHDFLMQLNREMQMTMVVVTHNMKLAKCMQRCMTIQDGKLVNMEP
ncbi:MAG: ABC transporter ATP-binding protein [Thermodesulfobacteriota bacterium]